MGTDAENYAALGKMTREEFLERKKTVPDNKTLVRFLGNECVYLVFAPPTDVVPHLEQLGVEVET